MSNKSNVTPKNVQASSQTVKKVVIKKTRRSGKNRRYNRYKKRSYTRGVPRAFGSSSQTYASIKVSKNRTFLKTSELFYPKVTDGVVDFMLPMTPTKWTNTRTSTLASTFSGCLPIALDVRWLPNAPTSSSASIAFGTVFDGINFRVSQREQAPVVLAATNGGFVSSIWLRKSSRITLGRNLNKKSYPLFQTSMDDIPLWLLLQIQNGDVNSNYGYLQVIATWELFNPITATPVQALGQEVSYRMDHDEQNNKTIVTITSPVSTQLNLGERFEFVGSTPHHATDQGGGGILAHVLEPLFATVTSIAGNVITATAANVFRSSPTNIRYVGRLLQQIPEINFQV